MKYIKLGILFISLCQLFGQKITAQQKPSITWNLDGSVTVVGEKEFIYDTPYNFSEEVYFFSKNAFFLDPTKIFSINKENYGVMVTDVKNPAKNSFTRMSKPNIKGGVILEMFTYDTNNQLESDLMYGCYAEKNGTYTWQSESWIYNWITNSLFFFSQILTNNIKQMANGYHKSTLGMNNLDKYIKNHAYRPIKLKITVKDATLNRIKIPAVGEFTPAQLFPPDVIALVEDAKTLVTSTYDFREGENDIEIKAKLGDKVSFKVNSKSTPTIKNLPATWLAATGREYYYHCDPSIVPGGLKPIIPFDVQSHYVSSNFNDKTQPKYPNWSTDPNNSEFKTFEWRFQRVTDNLENYIPRYKFLKAAEHFKKMQRKNKNEGQMMEFLNLLREGTNQYKNKTYTVSYDRKAPQYYWNIDSDELIFLNSTDMNYNSYSFNFRYPGYILRIPAYKIPGQPMDLTKEKPLSINNLFDKSKIAKPATEMSDIKKHIGSLYEPWQLVREGDYKWGSDGYPESGFVINELVNSYWSMKDNSVKTYRGYEIEDLYMYKLDDYLLISTNGEPIEIGKGTTYNYDSKSINDNVKHPGKIILTFDGKEVKIGTNIESPLAKDYGFYGNIIVPKYSNVLSKQKLKVIGLPKGILKNSLKEGTYELKIRSYSLQDFPVKTYDLKRDGTYESSQGEWLIDYDTDYNQGQSATLYYNGVIVSGQEWKNTNINYLFSKVPKIKTSGNKEIPDPTYVNLETGYEEFVDNYTQDKRYAFDSSQGFVNNYDGKTFWNTFMRHYVLDKKAEQKKIQISCMDALDNMWDMKGGAYYWGYRALAKQISDEEIAKNLVYVLTTPSGQNEKTYNKRDFTFDSTDREVGVYTLQVFSKLAGTDSEDFDLEKATKDPISYGYGNPSPKVEIRVVDYSTEPVGANKESALGKIAIRKLYEKERQILGMLDKKYDDYQVASITNILATHMYADKNYRAKQDDGGANRFAKHNDFNDKFEWTTTDFYNNDGTKNKNPKKTIIPILPDDIKTTDNKSFANFIKNDFNPVTLWNTEWKNWLRHFSYGKFPNSTMTPNDSQTYDQYSRNQLKSIFQEKDSKYKLTPFLRALIWLAPTRYDGYRINGLMKTIVDLPEFFNNYAFEGIASPSQVKKPTDLLPPFVTAEQDMSDDNKFKEYFFRRLKNGGMIIYNPNKVKNLTVYNINKDYDSAPSDSNKKFIATTESSSPISLMIGQDLTSIKEYVDDKTDGKQSFPTPAAVTSYLNLFGLLTINNDPKNDNNLVNCPTTLVDAYGGLGEDPTGKKYYTYFKNWKGVYKIAPYNKGGGTIDTRLLADTYPNSDLNIGLLISTIVTPCKKPKILANMNEIKNGKFDAEIDRLIQFCKSRFNQTIYLRVGYEFDLVWNAGYHNTYEYKKAYNYIVNRMKNDKDLNNVKYVWQASCSPFNYVDYLAFKKKDLNENLLYTDNKILTDPSDFEKWFPSKENVDIVALSWFENAETKSNITNSEHNVDYTKISLTQKELSDKLLTIARKYSKPVMIAESTPRGYDLEFLTKSNTHRFWDGPIANNDKKDKSGLQPQLKPQVIWDNFYQSMFDYINENSDVIKYLHYINANWAAKDQYQWNTKDQYWGDSRVQKNATIKGKWIEEITKPKWIHGNNKLHGASIESFKSKAYSTKVELEWMKNDQPKIRTQKIQLFEETVNKLTKKITEGTLVYNENGSPVIQDGKKLYLVLNNDGKPRVKEGQECDPLTETYCIMENGSSEVPLYNFVPAYSTKKEKLEKKMVDNPSYELVQHTFIDLKSNTKYKAVLTFLDYQGKGIGIPSTLYFSTLTPTSGRPLLAGNTEEEKEEPLNNSIPIKQLNDFIMYPNPTSDAVSIYFSLENEMEVNISVIDLGGNLLFQETSYRNKGDQEYKLNNLKRNINKGVLMVKITAGTESIVKKLLIE